MDPVISVPVIRVGGVSALLKEAAVRRLPDVEDDQGHLNGCEEYYEADRVQELPWEGAAEEWVVIVLSQVPGGRRVWRRLVGKCLPPSLNYMHYQAFFIKDLLLC